MIFYDCATAPSPRRARMFLAEKGLSPEVREVSIAEGAQLAPEFIAVNPNATVPVLVTDEGTVLTENLGIAAYLEAFRPDPPLIGRSPDETGLIWSWTAYAEQQGGIAIAEALRNGNPHLKGRALPGPVNYDQIPELAQRGMARAIRFFDKLDARLADTPYLAGEDFTLADITAFCFVDFARIIKLRVDDSRPHLKHWYDRISARPSAAL